MKNQITRMCFICRNTFEKKHLNRLVKTADGNIFFDKTGKANGRGAYICNSANCVSMLSKQKILNRAFKCEVPQEVYNQICEELIDNKH